MNSLSRLFLAVLVMALTSSRVIIAADTSAITPPLLLISMDAFRWDYTTLHHDETPNLQRLMHEGISARGLIPVFPSNTFANHYSIATGLYPSHHGIVNNEFFDPRLGTFFRYNNGPSVSESRWWGGEPIWITAVQQARKAGISFWVGSEAEIHGKRPTFWRRFDSKLPFEQRLDEISGWLNLPAPERPQLFVVYLEEANVTGHKFGPESPELIETLKLLDSRVGQLMDRFRAAGVEPNAVIVSDHGMTEISKDRVILLDRFITPSDVQVDFDGPCVGLRPLHGDGTEIIQALTGLRHAKAYLVDDLPPRFHVSSNPRNPPVWIVPEEGWEIYFESHYKAYRDRMNHGDHGYDPALPSMHGILIAHGPSFRADGSTIPDVENIHVYNLLCRALGLTPAPNDGDDRLVRAMLAP